MMFFMGWEWAWRRRWPGLSWRNQRDFAAPTPPWWIEIIHGLGLYATMAGLGILGYHWRETSPEGLAALWAAVWLGFLTLMGRDFVGMQD
ncbi:hypothetical protein TPY_2683 [Sulfobacillus acidophilus TPY]|nr:hypothetical protein TPY_2683 [Sulfobacillus acidophilus TPY]